MPFIFMDESGDLGFDFLKSGTSKYFLITYVTNILLDRIFIKKLIPLHSTIELIASKRETNKFLNANFRDYIENQATDNHSINLKVEIRTPAEEKSLQAVDFVSWAIFRKYEYGDEDYYNTIKGSIVEENPLFP